MQEFFSRAVVTAIGVWLAVVMVSGITVTDMPTWWQQLLVYLAVGVVLALVQMIVKPVVKALTFVLYILTLGLFGVVVNALMLMLCSWFTSHLAWGIEVESFFPAAVLGSIIIAIVTSVLTALLPRPRPRRRR